MNQEATDFAAYRFTQRTARSRSDACAVQHFAPHREHRAWTWLRVAVCLAAAAAIGAMISTGA